MSRRLLVLLIVLAILSVAPFLILYVWSQITRDPGVAWHMFRFIHPQIAIWILFVITLVYGVAKYLVGASKDDSSGQDQE